MLIGESSAFPSCSWFLEECCIVTFAGHPDRISRTLSQISITLSRKQLNRNINSEKVKDHTA